MKTPRLLSVWAIGLLFVLNSPSLNGSGLTIGAYQLVSVKPSRQGLFDYTYRASITNSGSSVQNVSATLVAAPLDVDIIDASLSFGDVPPGATIAAQDTFIIRQKKNASIDPSVLQWSVQSTAVNSPPIADAGRAQAVPVGATVQLSGASSRDADGDPLTYTW